MADMEIKHISTNFESHLNVNSNKTEISKLYHSLTHSDVF